MHFRVFFASLWIIALCFADEPALPVEGSSDNVKGEIKNKAEIKGESTVKFEKDGKGKRLSLDFSIELKSISNPDLLFSHFANRSLVIFYFSVKCKHCVVAFPYIKQLAEDLGQKDVSIVAVAVKNNKEDDIRNFIRKNETGFPVFHDSNKKFSSLYGTGRIPLIIAVNPQGSFLKFQNFDGKKTPGQILELFSRAEFSP